MCASKFGLSTAMLSALRGIGSGVRRGYFEARTIRALEKRGLVAVGIASVTRDGATRLEPYVYVTDAGRGVVAQMEAA